ncbi:hypothetical protein CDL15_Pgr000287 [Punica granatum]|uniref:Uncharacterized protein n=1 Tax=Punica granatum TaxID=22663 RepID=A0A218Y244_PUNGR|nr:hypothetical protein CDL15_Pgr000287 [Punica granatum]
MPRESTRAITVSPSLGQHIRLREYKRLVVPSFSTLFNSKNTSHFAPQYHASHIVLVGKSRVSLTIHSISDVFSRAMDTGPVHEVPNL